MADGIAPAGPLLSQIGQITFTFRIQENGLCHKRYAVPGSLFQAVVRGICGMFNSDVGNALRRPFLLPAGPVDHPGNCPSAHGVHGELTVVFPAEGNGGFHQIVAAYGNAVFPVCAGVRPVHPGGPPGDASVADQLQTGRENRAVPVQEFRGDTEVFVVRKEIPHIIDSDVLAEPFFCRRLIDGQIIFMVQVAHIADGGDSLGGEKTAQLQKVLYFLLPGLRGQQDRDKAAGIFLENAGGLSVFSALDFSARRIRCVPVNSGQLQGHTVDTADMRAGAQHIDR